MATDIEKVRVITQDNTEPYLFSDTEIETLLEAHGDNPLLASAAIFYSIAVNEALLYKYVKTDDLMVDGTKAAGVLIKRAEGLEAQAAAAAITDDFVIAFPPSPCPIIPEGTARPFRWA